MARPRKPTSQLAPSYAKKKRVRKERANEPTPTDAIVGRAERLNEIETACWDRIVKLVPPGVLRSCDEIIVELTARLWARLKGGGATAADATQLRACLQQLGMTPASRSHVSGGSTEKPVNEFADA